MSHAPGGADDNPLAVNYGRRLTLMSLIQNVGLGTNGLNPNNTVGALQEDTEHGELGVLQRFQSAVLVGGGRPSGGARAVEPNTTGLTQAMQSILLGEAVMAETRGL